MYKPFTLFITLFARSLKIYQGCHIVITNPQQCDWQIIINLIHPILSPALFINLLHTLLTIVNQMRTWKELFKYIQI